MALATAIGIILQPLVTMLCVATLFGRSASVDVGALNLHCHAEHRNELV